VQCDGEPGRTPGRAESLHRSEEAVASAVVAPMVMRVVVSVGGGGGTGGGGEGDGGGATPAANAAPSCVSDEFVKLERRSRLRAFDTVFS